MKSRQRNNTGDLDKDIPSSRNSEFQETIEILSVDLLDQNRNLVEALKGFTRSLRLELGWHYLLDLTWIISQLGEANNRRIMDAGAGIGVLQWYLAQDGAEVVSVDRSSRADLSLRFRNRFRVTGLRPEDLLPPGKTLKARLNQKNKGALPRQCKGPPKAQTRTSRKDRLSGGNGRASFEFA